MNRAETLKLILVIKNTYPKTYEKFSPADFEGMADMWTLIFEDYSYQEMSLALKAYLTTNTSGFPPVPAQLIEFTRQKDPVNTMSSAEAWDLVYKAICNSGYNSEAEFNKLPEICQKVIGTPHYLKELSQMDMNTVKGVEGAIFRRNYEGLLKERKEYEKVPQATRDQLEVLRARTLIEEKL